LTKHPKRPRARQAIESVLPTVPLQKGSTMEKLIAFALAARRRVRHLGLLKRSPEAHAADRQGLPPARLGHRHYIRGRESLFEA